MFFTVSRFRPSQSFEDKVGAYPSGVPVGTPLYGLANINIGRVTNSLHFDGTELITAVNCLIIQVQGHIANLIVANQTLEVKTLGLEIQ